MAFLILIAVFLFVGFGGHQTSIERQISPIVSPHVFSLASWEVSTLAAEIFGGRPPSGDNSTVIKYFQISARVRSLEQAIERGTIEDPRWGADELNQLRRQRDTLQPTVARVLEQEIRRTLDEQGIRGPVPWPGPPFPPVNIALTSPPLLLVISPRDRIETVSNTMIKPDTGIATQENIEQTVAALNYSGLVTPIGGLAATFPAFVADDMDLKATIESAAHEWVHQYLAFRPLGFLYVLDVTGVRSNADIRSLNETLADIVGKEIGELVLEQYYPAVAAESKAGDNAQNGSFFGFNATMHQIRLRVDDLLARGRIEEAEQYMNNMRDYLQSQGYYIRKLNQAYFAFHGTYADTPASTDPIGKAMQELRRQSPTVKSFLDRASAITSRAGLERAVAPRD